MTGSPSPPEPTTRLGDLRLAGPAAAAWLAAATVLATTPALALGVALSLGAAGALALRWRRRAATALAAALVCAAAASAAAGLRLAAISAGPVARLATVGASVTVELTVTGDPELHAGRVRGSALRRPLVVVPARVSRVQWRGSTARMHTPVTVLATGSGWTGLLPSQRLAVTGRLAPARGRDLVAAALLARGPPHVLSRPSTVQRVAGRIRTGLRSASAGLPADAAGLLPGLVLGDTSRLSPALREDFRTTGMTHLVAVSGANVAIVLGAVLVLARWLRLGPRLGPAAAGLALTGFVVLARPSASVLRAAAMGVVVVLALATGRARAALPALFAAVVGLLVVEPALALSVGFALSVAATGGLLILAPPLASWLGRWLPRRLAEAIAVPLAAQTACAPLITMVSAQVSLVAVPANLLAAPAVVPATLFGVLAALVAPWWPGLGRLLAEIAGLPAGFIVRVAHTGAGMPGAALPWTGGSAGALLLTAASAAVALAVPFAIGRRVLATLLVSVLVAVGAVRALAPGWPPPGWQLVVCDVGQGDALVLSAGSGTAVLVDAGPDPALVARCLRALKVRRVPLVVLTHLHADHVEGLSGVLRGHGVQEVEIGPLDEPAEEHARVLSWVRGAGARLSQAVPGERRTLGALSWQVLAPAAAFHRTNSDPNNSSIVLRVQLAGFRALLTGDVEPPAQQALLQAHTDVTADVLKVPHHGSAHQEPAFLAATGASLAITSVGAGNTYGHPSAATLARLRADGMRTYRTDRDGAVALRTMRGGVTAVGTRGSGSPPIGGRFTTGDGGAAPAPGPALAAVLQGPLGPRSRHRRYARGMLASNVPPATLVRRAARSPAARAPPSMRDSSACRRQLPR